MPGNIQILSVTPQNVSAGIPGRFQVTGEVTGCETIHVGSSCSGKSYEVPIPSGGTNQWQVVIDNDNGCGCGATITVRASCVLGYPEADTFTSQFTIDCDACPSISIDPPLVGDCVGTKRNVTLTAHITGQATLYWDYGDGTFSAPFVAPPSQVTTTHAYSPPGPHVARLMVVPPTNCPPATRSVDSLPSCSCPPGQYFSTAQGTCIDCPPHLTLNAPIVTGSAGGVGGTSATASFTAVPHPGTIVATYVWSVTTASGSTADRTSTSPTVDTTSGWMGPGTSGGAVDLSQPGACSVSVYAILSGDAATCPQLAGRPFTVLGICPKPAASGEWSVTGNLTAAMGPATFETVDCDTAKVTITFAASPGGYQPSDLHYQWDFGDGTVTPPMPGPLGATQTHTFTNAPGQRTTYTVVVTAHVPGSNCPPVSRQMQVTVPGCPKPPDGPELPDDGPVPQQPSGGISLCDALLWIWITLFIAAGVLFYFGLNWPGVGSLILWAVVLGIWIGVCCLPCARRFWMCCPLLQWLLLATMWLLQIFAILQALSWILGLFGIAFPALTSVVAAFYTLFGLTIVLSLLGVARCRVPNPWVPSDWPPSRC